MTAHTWLSLCWLALGCNVPKPAAPAASPVPDSPAAAAPAATPVPESPTAAAPTPCTTGPHTLAVGQSLDLGAGRSVRLEHMGHKIVDGPEPPPVLPGFVFTDTDGTTESVEGRVGAGNQDVAWRDLTLTVTDFQLRRSVTFTVAGCAAP